MSEVGKLAKEFLSKNSEEKKGTSTALTPHNSFRAMFGPSPLEEPEMKEIEKIFQNGLIGDEDEEAVRSDFRELVRLTSELKAIQKQAILLIGERIFQVREIFLRYGEERGGFTEWLLSTFKAKKTAYNALAFYDLYRKLPSTKLQENFKKMPAKAGYILASRKGPPEIKWEIIENYNGEKQQFVIELIEEKLPISSTDKRSKGSLVEKTLDEMGHLIDLIDRRIAFTNPKDKERLERLILRLRSIADAF